MGILAKIMNTYLSEIKDYFHFVRYNQIDSGEDAQEEFGWKLVHGDVFRPPRKGMLLSVFIGSGTKLLILMGLWQRILKTCNP